MLNKSVLNSYSLPKNNVHIKKAAFKCDDALFFEKKKEVDSCNKFPLS